MKAWLSMMPVEGESRAASQFSAGSNARAACLPQPPRDVEADHPRTDNDALNFIHSRFRPGYSTRRACDEAALIINRIRTLSLCRKSLFRGVFQTGLPLGKH